MLEWLSKISALYKPIFKIKFFYLLLGFELALQFVTYWVGLVSGKLIKNLTDKNSSQFWIEFAYGVGLIAINVIMLSLVTYFERRMYISFRSDHTQKILNSYFEKNNFYKLNNSSLDNVDQRISMDIERFTSTSSQIIKVIIITPFTLCWYIYKCYEKTSWWGPLACFVFFIIGSLVNNITLPRVIRESQLVEAREGDYRWQNARIRKHAENISLSKAANFEHVKTTQTAEKLFRQQIKLENTSFVLNTTVNVFDYFGGLLPYFCLAPLVFGGRYDDLSPGDLNALISENSFVLGFLVYQFTTLFDQIRKFGDVLAYGKRIIEVYIVNDTVNDTDKEIENPNSIILGGSDIVENNHTDDLINVTHSSVPVVSVSKLTNFKPRKLFHNFSFELLGSESMIIEGPNGSGKTSLIRLISGLWRADGGKIKLPSEVMFLQETPVLTDGTLMEQILYPDDGITKKLSVSQSIKQCQDALRTVGLDHLVLDLHKPARWETILSCGEKQKILFARLIVYRPKLAFLDESSSSLSMKSERHLYSTLQNLGIQLISISHRPSNIEQFHQYKLTLMADCLYAIAPIEH